MKNIIVICGLLIFGSGCGFNCNSYLDEHIRPLTIEGTVFSKQKSETGCFGSIVILSAGKYDTFSDMCFCVPAEQGLWKYVKEGDGLHKSAQSLTVTVSRYDSTKNFQYPCCSQ